MSCEKIFSDVFFIFSIDLNMIWFIVGEAIIGVHPLSNGLITLTLLRPYRRAFKKLFLRSRKNAKQQYDSLTIGNVQFMEGDSLL